MGKYSEIRHFPVTAHRVSPASLHDDEQMSTLGKSGSNPSHPPFSLVSLWRQGKTPARGCCRPGPFCRCAWRVRRSSYRDFISDDCRDGQDDGRGEPPARHVRLRRRRCLCHRLVPAERPPRRARRLQAFFLRCPVNRQRRHAVGTPLTRPFIRPTQVHVRMINLLECLSEDHPVSQRHKSAKPKIHVSATTKISRHLVTSPQNYALFEAFSPSVPNTSRSLGVIVVIHARSDPAFRQRVGHLE